MNKKLYKSRKDKQLCGVCSGIAQYFSLDATIVRLALVWSVTCTRPPVSFHISHVSIVPKSSLPTSAFSLAPGTLSSIHLILEPEKYASG